ncbi:MAG: cyclic nucleotide-binding domain-containing protein [Myxococcota bacterium]
MKNRDVVSTVEKVLFLKSIDLFREIPGEDLARVAQIAEEVELAPGEVLLHQDEIGDSMYLIIEGRVQVLRDERVIAELTERECVGEMAMLDSEPRSATVKAMPATRLLKVEREDLYELMSEKMPITHGIIKVLTRRLRQTLAQTPDASR